MPMDFAPLPDAPYVAVIFASKLKDESAGYAEMAEKMAALAAGYDGFIGVDSARGDDGFGITVSYWRDMAAVKKWRADAAHLMAQKLGHDRWYDHYSLRIAEVHKSYDGSDFENRRVHDIKPDNL